MRKTMAAIALLASTTGNASGTVARDLATYCAWEAVMTKSMEHVALNFKDRDAFVVTIAASYKGDHVQRVSDLSFVVWDQRSSKENLAMKVFDACLAGNPLRLSAVP